MTRVFLPLVFGVPPVRKTVCARQTKPSSFLNCETYNIGYEPDVWVMAAGDRIRNIGTQALVRDVELLCLQEVMHRGAREEVTGFRNFFRGWYWMTYPHDPDNHYSNLLLSVYPFVKGSERMHTIVSQKGRNDRVNLSVQVNTPAGVVRVADTHTRVEEPEEGTKQTTAWLEEVLALEPHVPLILMGDFNTQRGNVLRIAKGEGLRLDATHAGRIDHICVRGVEIVEECTSPRPSVPGEHDPIFATVARKG